MFDQIRNIKPRYQGLMSRFSRNDPNQRYYLNGMWTCEPPVMIVNFLLMKKLRFTQACCLPRDLELNINSSRFELLQRTTIHSNFNRATTDNISRSTLKCLKFQHWANIKNKKITLKTGKDFQCVLKQIWDGRC